jgi:hypothetical protein
MSARSSDLTSHHPLKINETFNNVEAQFIQTNELNASSITGNTSTPVNVDFTSITSFNIPSSQNLYLTCTNFLTSSGTYTMTLPSIEEASAAGVCIYILMGDTSLNAGTGTLNIVTTSPDTINGLSSFSVFGSGSAQFGFNTTPSIIQIYCTGSQWVTNTNVSP